LSGPRSGPTSTFSPTPANGCGARSENPRPRPSRRPPPPSAAPRSRRRASTESAVDCRRYPLLAPNLEVPDARPGAPGRQKIAVLGGGIGALAAVWNITNEPGWHEKYAITVYQVGWRLGGKCASGRNREIAARIEEHGLHIFLGFYENAFRLVRQCYAEL